MLELAEQTDVPFYVVITMRSDFIGDCSQFYNLPETMNKSQYLVPKLNRVQLKTVIEGPARLYGGKVTPGLSSRLINDLGKVKDELPLLQHALMRIWDHDMEIHNNCELDIPEYEAIGGIENTLSNHADEAIAGMSDDELNLTKKIFQALTAVDENGRKIRRPVLLSELKALTGASEQQLMQIIDRFIKEKRSFLIVNKAGNDSIIDISHESLIRQWKNLCLWVEEENEATSNYLHLSDSATLYRKNKKDLLAGAELHLAWDWYNKFKPVDVWANRYRPGFSESIDYLMRSEKDWAARKLAERKKRRTRRMLGWAVIILLALVAVSVGIRNYEIKELKKKSQAAFLAAAAQNVLSTDPTLALDLAEASLNEHFDSAAFILENQIYAEHSFYKIVAYQPT
ncbi:MAG TPA: hypothetical protein VKH37_02305, partial [Ferruginibacter sp.]|nr:hypothetical protein [Ferruginibacter sp.]